jgi:hypothetical protein
MSPSAKWRCILGALRQRRRSHAARHKQEGRDRWAKQSRPHIFLRKRKRMGNISLDHVATQEIRTIVSGLAGKSLTAEVQRLCGIFEVSPNRIYDLTKDLRPARKTRADKGQRKYSLDHPSVQFVLDLILNNNLDPHWALRVARDNGHELDISEATMSRYLREHNLSLKQRKNPIRPYRRWEADAPGELFQFDISASKTRWLDRKTRKILRVPITEVNRNHPNDDPNRVPLWRFVLVDDFSRMVYARYYAISKENGVDIADFLLRAFRELGVPKILYTDNAKTIVNKMLQRGARILNEAFAESGGYRMLQHLPNNAQASGKVENFHLKFEKLERLIGVKKFTPDLEGIHRFCEEMCHYFNHDVVHSTTRQRPITRWQSVAHTMRIPTDAALDQAFKCKEFERVIGGDLTISIEGQLYQLPRQNNSIVRDWIGKKVLILWPSAEADWLAICNTTDLFYADVWLTVDRKLAVADTAGEFKSVSDNTQQSLLKTTKQQGKARRAAIIAPEQDVIVPGFDTPLSTQVNQPIAFPKPRVELTPDQLAAHTPGVPQIKSGMVYWDAIDWLVKQEQLTYEQADKDWLRGIYGDRDQVAENELLTALENRFRPAEILTFQRRKLA